MKNLFNAAFAAMVSCLLSCVGCASTRFDRSEVHTPSTDVVKQCSSTRYRDTTCVDYVETKREDLGYGMGAGVGYGMYPQGMMMPAVQSVSYEPMVTFPSGERGMEGISGGPVRYEPVAIVPPAGDYATKDQLKSVALQVRDLKRQQSKGKSKSESMTDKEGK